MKKILIPVGTILLSGLMQAQLTSTENYVQSRMYLEPVTTTSSTAKQIETVQYFDGLGRPKQIVNVKASPSGKDVVTPILYDGFGRQTMDYLPVPQQGTNNGGIYSQQTSGNFPIGDPTGIYTNEKPFSEKILESSPLDRVLQQKQVGMAWDTKPVQLGYDANTTGDAVKKYTTVTTWVNGATSSVLSQSTNYGTAQLYKNTVTDEDGNVTIEFKNGEGQTLLVRKMISDTEKADTYYVYNEYNQLAFVVSPKAAMEADPNTVLGDLCYQYKYDGRGRLVEKKIPGKGWEYIVYDKADRVFMIQDATMRPSGNWLLTRYDKLSRVVYTAIAGIGSTYIRKDIQDAVNYHSVTASSLTEERTSAVGFTKNGMDIYYGNNTYPTNAIVQVLSVNYYDTYPPGTPAIPTQILGQDVLSQDAQNSPVSTKSLPVASFVKNIEDDNWTKNYIGYDKKGRTIGTYSFNHLGGYTKVESVLDFAGVALTTNTYQIRRQGEVGVTVQERFVYDSQNRLLQHYHKVDDNTEVLLAENTYNELSQLKNKTVGNNLQSIDYAYNIRGWLTGINQDQMQLSDLGGKLFSYKIKYNEKEGITTPDQVQFPGKEVAAKYNGNIAEVDWRSVENIGNYPSTTPKRYGYVYDRLNRLTAGFYQTPNNANVGENTESLTYDLNGNITKLFRTSVLEYGNTTPTKIDDLEYIYDAQNKSNKLITLNDNSFNPTGYEGGGLEIKYDVNGNMTEMPDKGINKIEYNYLNLPDKINYSKGGTESAVITTRYSADGIKLQKENNTTVFGFNGSTTTTKITDYLDGFQYLTTLTPPPPGGFESLMMANSETGRALERQAYTFDDSSSSSRSPVIAKNSNLQFFPTTEGYYDYAKNQYIYQYKDHLGNTRISFGRNSSGNLEITDNNDYYPFGMNHLKSGNAYYGAGSYKNYKYNGKELQEIGMYDYGARMYMADVGRWGVVDPLSELQFGYSPYSYVFGNPVTFNDPTGMIGEDPDLKKIYGPKGGFPIEEVVLKGISKAKAMDSSLSFMGIQSLNAYHGSEDRLAAGIRGSNAALATEKFERNLAFAMGTFIMGGSNILASAGWATFDAYMSYQDEEAQEAVGKVQIAALLFQVSHGNISGIQKFVTVDASRINIAKGITRFTPLRLSGQPVSAGWKHVVEGHFNRPLGNSRSIFSITENQVKNILQSKIVLNSPITPLTGGQFQRTVDTGQIIGNAALKQGGGATSWINVITDYKGNLITTYPVVP